MKLFLSSDDSYDVCDEEIYVHGSSIYNTI